MTMLRYALEPGIEFDKVVIEKIPAPEQVVAVNAVSTVDAVSTENQSHTTDRASSAHQDSCAGDPRFHCSNRSPAGAAGRVRRKTESHRIVARFEIASRPGDSRHDRRR